MTIFPESSGGIRCRGKDNRTMYKLENIEWTQTWFEQSEPRDKARVLLIGDSISVGYRSPVHKELGGEWYVTAHSTSKALDNPWFMEEIAMTAKQVGYTYDHVHFNNGLHGWHLSEEEYREGYEKAILGLKELFPNARISLVTSTSTCKMDNGVMVLREDNDIVIARNKIVRELAAKYDLPVDDLYAVSAENNNYHGGDGVHFTGEGYNALAKQVAEFLKGL